MKSGIRARFLTASAMVTLAGLSCTAAAHHSAADWNLDKRISVTGTIRMVSVRNPHGLMELDVTGSDGKQVTWHMEMSAKNLLVRRGWKPERMKAGDTITVTGHPNKTAADALYVREVKLADGTVFGDPEGKDKQLD